MDWTKKINDAAEYIIKQINIELKIGIVLGSGLGSLTDEMSHSTVIPFSDIPHFPKTSVKGHEGSLVIGSLHGVNILAMRGRYHYYEGLSLQEVTFPIRVMKALQISTLILTNACGAVNTSFHPGELMLISDHINLTANNPLIGKNLDEYGERFPDASEIYSKKLRNIAQDCANQEGLVLREGVYAFWTGPSYETPAEIRMIRIVGADAVGMSTVPEALVASQMSMKVLGISCLTNMATGVRDQQLTHEEVLHVAKSVEVKFKSLLTAVVKKVDELNLKSGDLL